MSENFTKTIRPGTVPTYDGKRHSVYCKIEYADGRLSITGVVGPKTNGDAHGGAGQIDMEFAHRNPTDNDSRYSAPIKPDEICFADGWGPWAWLEFLDVWKHWHLNDMQAGCEHQQANWDRTKTLTLYHWRLRPEIRARLRDAEKVAAKQLRAGETVSLPDDALAIAALPVEVTTGSDVPPSEEYVPNGPQYKGDTYNRASETKTAGWVRPEEHPGGLLGRPCEVCGYEYGSAWRRQDVPADVLEFLRELPDADRAPAWV